MLRLGCLGGETIEAFGAEYLPARQGSHATMVISESATIHYR
jgi:hypothetical protein